VIVEPPHPTIGWWDLPAILRKERGISPLPIHLYLWIHQAFIYPRSLCSVPPNPEGEYQPGSLPIDSPITARRDKRIEGVQWSINSSLPRSYQSID